MIGLVIGKGGANVNSVKEQTGVERIVVDPEEGVVRVVGHAKEDVERAGEMLEYAMEKLTLESEDVGSLLAPSQSGRSVVLNEIRDKAGLVRAQLTDDRSTLELIGTKVAVKSAMMLVKTRLEYRKKISQTQQETDSYYREAADIDYSYGYEHSYRYDDEFPAIGRGLGAPETTSVVAKAQVVEAARQAPSETTTAAATGQTTIAGTTIAEVTGQTAIVGKVAKRVTGTMDLLVGVAIAATVMAIGTIVVGIRGSWQKR